MSWGSAIKAAPGHSLGQVSFSTGALTSGGIWTGGTWAGGGYFIVRGVGAWTKNLAGSPQGPVMLFNGSFVGPVLWTVQSIGTGGFNYIFTLSGAIRGMYYDGRTVNGTTTQYIYAYTNQWIKDRKGGISLGYNNINVPEPGTLGLLGTGLIFVAGSLRRKLFGR